jgi:mycofactocin precursor
MSGWSDLSSVTSRHIKEGSVECKTVYETDVCGRSTEDDENPDILEEIEIEELTVDGICGVY